MAHPVAAAEQAGPGGADPQVAVGGAHAEQRVRRWVALQHLALQVAAQLGEGGKRIAVA